MSTKSQDKTSRPVEPSPTAATSNDQNSGVQEAPAPTEIVEVEGASPGMVPPIEPGTGEQAGMEPPPAPDAASRPETSKKAKTKSKPKSKSKRGKTDKTAGTAKPAAENPGDAGDAASKAAAGEGAPVLTCLQGVHIEPATSPPAGTLPPALEKLFTDAMSVAAVLAATGAAAGHGVRLDTGKNTNGEGTSLALRVAVVGETHALPGAGTAGRLRAGTGRSGALARRQGEG
jgi:hypothetical protein